MGIVVMIRGKSMTKRWPDFRFNWEETAGAVGDFGTLIPIVLGVAIVSDVNVGHILLFFSLWYIISGLYFRMPIPVEPMKAIGVVVIAEGLSSDEIAASGIILGILFLILGYCKGMKVIKEMVPNSVVRGIQLGLALMLLTTSFDLIARDYLPALIGVAIIALFYLAGRYWRVPDVSALVVIILGVAAGLFISGVPGIAPVSMPSLIIPGAEDFLTGAWKLAIPQAPLTMTNAILATALLMKDLVDRDVDPDELSKSIGIMNLSSAPFGGFPMCHGAGGLAAQYRYGARTGGSNIISGLILIPIALFFASPEFIAIIPIGIFGALLVFVAVELGKHGLRTDSYLITGVIALLSLLANIALAFIVGMLLAYTLKKRISGQVTHRNRVR